MKRASKTVQTTSNMDSSVYINRWLSRTDIREILKKNNITLSSAHITNIKKGRAKNFMVLNLLMTAAKQNEKLYSVVTTND